MGNIAHGHGLETNMALGFVLYYIGLSTAPMCNISHSALTAVKLLHTEHTPCMPTSISSALTGLLHCV